MPDAAPSTRATRVFAAACCGTFVLAGLALVPHLGLQNDECLYSEALLPPRAEAYSLHVGSYHVPLMLMNYVGTVKAILYRPLIHAFGTGVWATRVPMLLAGAGSIWLFYLWLLRLAGERAAAIGCGLLAADASYLLTTCFDWGPVALQHLLLIGGLLLLVQFWQERREWALAGGFFLFGLALWDKAVAVWMLSGMGIAAVSILPRQIAEVFSLRRLGTAVFALAVGALPLILYNAHTRGATFQGTMTLDTQGLAHKTEILRLTFDGSALFYYLGSEDEQTAHPHAPQGALQRVSYEAAGLSGHPHRDLLLWAFGLALLLAAWTRGRDLKIILFALVTMAVAWLQMLFTIKAGTGVHHTILLWPMPQVVIAVSLAAASRRFGRAGRPAVAAFLVLVMGSGLALINEYHVQMVRNGGSVIWTDAVFPLASYLRSTRADAMFPVDWDMMDNLRLLGRGRLPLRLEATLAAKQALTPRERSYLQDAISDPKDLFLTHVASLRFYPDRDARLAALATSYSYQPQTLATIADSNGRPTFEIYHFVRR